jgi:hypothetical protein
LNRATENDGHPHIRVWRSFYWHHGIDLGDGAVIHFAGEPGRSVGAAVRRTSMEGFLRGGELRVVRHRNPLPAEEVRARAARALGHTGYSLLWRNCEHFARWCAVGRVESPQVRDALAGAMALSLVAAGASALARQRGALLLGRFIPFAGPLGFGVSLAIAAASLLAADLSPFDRAPDRESAF